MRKSSILVLPALLGLVACGGSGDDGGSPSPNPDPSNPNPGTPGALTYVPGVYRDSDDFAARCAIRRTGTDPWSGPPWPDQTGSILHEKFFLRSWTNETYLWFDEVLDRNPSNTSNSKQGVLDYFSQLKTMALTDTGRPKDQFHFTYDTAEYRQLVTIGAPSGYGIAWNIVSNQVVVEQVQAGTAAAAQGVRRGARLLQVDGMSVVAPIASQVEAIIAAVFEPSVGATHTFLFQDRNAGPTFTAQLQADDIPVDAVPVVDVFDTDDGRIGYLLFNDHSIPAEAELRDAMTGLAAAQIDDLVLDLRYNGGGYLAIASELAYMIAGPSATANKTFEKLQFNSRYTVTDPVGNPIQPTPFYSTTRGFSVAPGQPLRSLDLDRVVVLTSERTCSASESIINSLRGIGIQVIQIGGDTCGKPYGFYAQDNCGTTYFTVQFSGVNDVGFGDYADGFSATRVGGPIQSKLPGCGASDDLTHDLGDPEEGQLKVALTRLRTGTCSGAPMLSAKPQASLWPADAPAIRKPPPRPWENNRILR